MFVLFLFVMLSFHSLFALSPSQKTFLDHIIHYGYEGQPIYGLPIKDRGLKDPTYQRILDSHVQATTRYSAALAELNSQVVSLNGFNILHTECGLGYGVGAFNEEDVTSTCLNSGQKLHTYAQKVSDVFFTEQKAKYQSLSVGEQLALVRDNYYFHFDLVILDRIVDRWLETNSFAHVKRNLKIVASNTPFVLLSLPNKVPDELSNEDLKTALQSPSNFFTELPFSHTKELPDGATKTHKLYLISMKGTEVNGRTYKGELKSYRAYWNRINWIGEDVVIKQYHRHTNGGFIDIEYFQNTLKFYELGQKFGFTFLPKMHAVQIKEDRLLFVAQHEGQNLKAMTDWMTPEQQKQTMKQVLDILRNLERKTLTNGDLWAANFVINDAGKVYLIDYDQADFSKGPLLQDFIKIAFTMAGGSILSYNNHKQRKDGMKMIPLSQFGPLRSWVKPIYDGKVSSISDLRLFMETGK